MPDGYYEVCVSGRRLTASGLLIEDGSFSDEYAVPFLAMPAERAHPANFIKNVARKAEGEGERFWATKRNINARVAPSKVRQPLWA